MKKFTSILLLAMIISSNSMQGSIPCEEESASAKKRKLELINIAVEQIIHSPAKTTRASSTPNDNSDSVHQKDTTISSLINLTKNHRINVSTGIKNHIDTIGRFKKAKLLFVVPIPQPITCSYESSNSSCTLNERETNTLREEIAKKDAWLANIIKEQTQLIQENESCYQINASINIVNKAIEETNRKLNRLYA